jgi:hypothetical protein
MNEKIAYTQDITGSIDSVLEYLKPDVQPRQPLLHANLLLTNLMALLRPIPIKKQEPEGPRVIYTAEQLGLGLQSVRALKDAVVRGVTEIERGEHLAARDSWHAGEQKPMPEAQGD